MTATQTMRRLFLAAIRTYQRYLSPYKGFSCAYRGLTGRRSCSELGFRAIRRHGIRAGLAILRQRTHLCGVAHRRQPPFHASAFHSQRGFCDPGCDLPCELPPWTHAHPIAMASPAATLPVATGPLAGARRVTKSNTCTSRHRAHCVTKQSKGAGRSASAPSRRAHPKMGKSLSQRINLLHYHQHQFKKFIWHTSRDGRT